MKTDNTVIGTSTDMTWDQLDAIEDLKDVSEFLTQRQAACLLLAQYSDPLLLQLLLTDGYTNDFTKADGFKSTQFARWVDEHFSETDTEILLKCAYIASLNADSTKA